MRPSLRISRHLYRALILLYPRSFRAEYGAELLDAFVSLGRGRGVWHSWRRTLPDFLTTIAQEWLDVLRSHRTRARGSRRDGRVTRGGSMTFDVVPDIRYAARQLARRPAYAAVATATLALGIGANSAIFSVVNGVLLRPLPFPDQKRVVMVWESNVQRGWPRFTTSPANYTDWREQNQVFEHLAAYASGSQTLTGAGEAERMSVTYAWADFFEVLGVPPLLGRTFRTDENQPGKDRVTILSHRLWRTRFGGDPNIVGRTLTLDGQPVEVVGVLPPDIGIRRDTDLWMPLAFDFDVSEARGAHYLTAVARLRSGVSIEQAEAAMRSLAAVLAQQYPETNEGWSVDLVPVHEQIVGEVRPALLLLLSAVGMVLLIACANVANLALAHGAGRRLEIATRAALGASRGRLVRQLLTESVVTALCGGILGLGLAYASVHLLKALGPENLPRLADIRIDRAVLGFTTLITVGTGLAFGALPAMSASRTDLTQILKSDSLRTVGVRGQRARSILLVLQVAMAVVLVIGAGLMLKSLRALHTQDPGFAAENVVTMRLGVPQSRYPDPQNVLVFYETVLQRASSVPGIESAATTTNLPLSGSLNFTFLIEGREEVDEASRPTGNFRVVSPDYFQTLQIPILRGRGFTSADRSDAPAVIVINQSLAQRYFPDQDPLGQSLVVQSGDAACPCEIVGVVGDVKQGGLADETTPGYYLPQLQSIWRTQSLVARTSLPASTAIRALRAAVRQVDPGLAVYQVQTLEERLADAVATPRFNSVMLALFAAVALILAVVGIYGVESYNVSQRVRELGVRAALGADGTMIGRLVVGHALATGGAGVAIGLATAVWATRLLETMLFAVRPLDAGTFAGVAILLVGVTAPAAYIPARRAARVDPMTALRAE
jgi:putative ABC transport system permease protein